MALECVFRLLILEGNERAVNMPMLLIHKLVIFLF